MGSPRIPAPCAPIGEVNGNSESEVYDICIDMQYSKTPHVERRALQERFAHEPWTHCNQQNPFKTFQGIRMKKRDDFEKLFRISVDKETAAKFDRQMAGLERQNAYFRSIPSNKGLLEHLERCGKVWKRSLYTEKTLKMPSRQRTNENIRGTGTSGSTSQQHQEFYEALLERLKEEMKKTRADKDKVKEAATCQAPGATGSSRRRPSLFSTPSEKGQVPTHGQNGDQAQTSNPGAAVGPASKVAADHDQDDEDPELYGIKAGAIYFEKKGAVWTGQTCDDKCFEGSASFPDQKIAAYKLLKVEKDNPLIQKCPENTMRWFHFPTNNMSWIETAIARYYDEKPQPVDDVTPRNKRTRKTDQLLSREFWHGQMHGTSGKDRAGSDLDHGGRRTAPVHARHMRSKCSVIPRPSAQASPAGKGKDLAIFIPYLHWETSSRRAKMVNVVRELTNATDDDKQDQAAKVDMPGLFETWKKMKPEKQDKKTHLHRLGDYLMAAARVFDAMDYESDEQLLRENLNRNPPLHIRRTLDQYYFLTLDDTTARDRDQVVYRGTKKFDKGVNSWTTRVVMVDQLWLWVLDDNTIISAFPRRWGRNKPDPSGVHKSIRQRLESKTDDIVSPHHLALIIIDQCSRVFFDRTKPLDQRPEVMDLFGSAIGNVTELTATAYKHFWDNLTLISQNMLPGMAKHKYLEINPEGTLLKESQDIVEELKIMKRIYAEQGAVVKDMRRFLDDQEGQRRRRVVRQGSSSAGESADEVMKRLLDAFEARFGTGRGAFGEPGDDCLHEAEVLMELIESRQAEIQELEDSAMRTCQQLENLLSLKQQQASIVEAKAALQQGQAITAFTVVTMIFLPLSFFATFFGMNNADINDAAWMTLTQQIYYMFPISAVITIITVSLAFSGWARARLLLFLRGPIRWLRTRLRIIWQWFYGITGLRKWRENTKKRREQDDKQRREAERKHAKAQSISSLRNGGLDGNGPTASGRKPGTMNVEEDMQPNTAVAMNGDANGVGQRGGRRRRTFPLWNLSKNKSHNPV